jgi:integrase
MKVTLRQREKNGTVSLYLDYYSKGRRKYEYLDLYLVPEPVNGKLSKEERDSNKKNLALAELIRSKRHLEIQTGLYGFTDIEKSNGSFISYVEKIAQQRSSSKGNSDNWNSMIRHLKIYSPFNTTFAQINKDWLEGYKSYLSSTAMTPSRKRLSQNSQSAYYNKMRAALKQAFNDGLIAKNPASEVVSVKEGEVEKSFLLLEELQAMVDQKCDIPILKSAFLFSCLTGLRWSDVEKLTWGDIEQSPTLGYFIRYKQQKTKVQETLPISEQAYQILGEKGERTQKVFLGLTYSAWNNLKLSQWAMRSGITKKITFHSARHTFATLQLTLGTDIYTVSKMLGHRDLKHTQVYAKVIDRQKQEAANRIKINL